MMIPMFIPVFLRETIKKEIKPQHAGYHLFGSNDKIKPYENLKLSAKLRELGVKSNIQILQKDFPPGFLIDENRDLTHGGRIMLPMMSDGRFDTSRSEIVVDRNNNTLCFLKTFSFKTYSSLSKFLNSSNQKIFLMEFDIENELLFRAYFTDINHWSNGK